MVHRIEKSYAVNPHARLDEGDIVSAATPRRGASNVKKFLVALTSLFFIGAFAAEVDQDMASLAVRNWMKKSRHPMNARFKSEKPMRTQTVKGTENVPLFHVVEMEGGGFVITSGDTKIKPVIAFSDTDTFDVNARNPLFALLSTDISNRMARVSVKKPVKAKRLTAAGVTASGELGSYEAEWVELTAADSEAVDPGKNARKNGLYYASEGPLADVRVEPLVQAEWSQEDIGGEYAFNYYTPNHYECGCVVTAFAQVMRKWEYPAAAASGTYRCWVDGVAVDKDMMGGAYDWANMPFRKSDYATEAQRQAVGKLTYDLGVASQMQWDKDGSGAQAMITVEVLRKRFGYASCSAYSKDMRSNIGTSQDYRNAILASLDAGMPAVIGVSNGSNSGHEIVVDGYGFDGGADIYCHLNCGWSGLQNMWYNLIGESVTEWYGYTCVDNVAYNIHPTEVGEAVSGRVLSGTGTPVANASVTLFDMDGNKLAEKATNVKGIYAFRVDGANRYQIAATSGSVSSKAVTVTLYGRSINATRQLKEDGSIDPYSGEKHGIVANQWGVDVVLDDGKAMTVTFNANGGDGAMEPQSLASGVSQKLADCLFERAGYSFDGWATSAGGAVAYADGQLVTLTSGLALYAHWTKQPNTALIRYNANGGTGFMRSDVRSTTSEYGEYLQWNAFNRSGYAFMGWSLKLDGKVHFSDHDFNAYTGLTGRYLADVEENTSGLINLYAIWEKVDANGFVIQDGVLKKWNGTGSADIAIPEGVFAVGDYAFQNTPITSVAFPASLKSIGIYAFDSCSSLTNVRFSAGLKDIGNAAFNGCSSLFGVFELPEGVEVLEQIINGTRITDIVLPASIIEMRSQIFFGANVKSVWFKGNTPEVNNGDTWTPEYRYQCSPYYKASTDLVSYVPVGSTGWKDSTSALPDVWPYYDWAQTNATVKADACRAIESYAGAPPKGTSSVVVIPEKVKVTFNANGGSLGTASPTMVVTNGMAYGKLPVAERLGYAFDGWANGLAARSTRVTETTIVTNETDHTLYAQWTEIPPPPPPDSGKLNTSFAKAQTIDGALYKGDALVGTVQVKVGKISKKGVVKVSAAASLLVAGKVKKVTAKAVNVTLDATGHVPPVKIAFKAPIGEMLFEMEADGTFTLKNGSYLMAEVKIGGALNGGEGTFSIEDFNLSVPGILLDELLPDGDPFEVSRGKWKFAKAATVKLAKPKKGAELSDYYDDVSGKDLIVDDTKGKTNLSGLKLTYTAKTGQFKGSFKVYALQGTGKKRKLAKYTVNVIGFVVDGVGYGQASCKKPAVSWTVIVY